MAAQNRSHGFHVVSNRSPSRIRSVRLISLGMTTRPSSSILRTIPVARNVPSLLDGGATLMPHCFAVCLCIPSMEFGGVIMRRKDLGRAGAGWILEKNSARIWPGAARERFVFAGKTQGGHRSYGPGGGKKRHRGAKRFSIRAARRHRRRPSPPGWGRPPRTSDCPLRRKARRGCAPPCATAHHSAGAARRG